MPAYFYDGTRRETGVLEDEGSFFVEHRPALGGYHGMAAISAAILVIAWLGLRKANPRSTVPGSKVQSQNPDSETLNS